MASELIKKGGAHEGVIVITDNQTAGKGQRGNTWIAEPGLNLTFSLILKPKFLAASEQFNLNIAISLGIHKTLSIGGDGFKVKWPNDIYHRNKKLGGILIQNTIKNNSIEDSIIGIGMNINQTDFSLPTATSLRLISDQEYDLNSFLDKLCHNIESEYLKLKSGKIATLKEDYLENLLGYNEERLFRAGQEFRGTITGVSSTGKLQIQNLFEVREFDFKEVEFL